MTSRRAFTIFLAACVLVAGACGGTDGSPGAGEPAGAGVAPAGAAAFVSLNTDWGSDEWKDAADLVRKFGGGDRLLQQLREWLAGEDIDFERDVKPALGPESDLVVLALPGDGSDPPVVFLTQPSDPAKLDALLRKGNDPSVSEVVEGWTVVSDKQESIDAFKQARAEGSLADSDSFTAAMDEFGGDAALRFYVDGRAVTTALSQSSGDQAGADPRCVEDGFGKALWLGGEVDAQDNGVRFEAKARSEGAPEQSTYASEFVDQVPAGTLAFVSFANLDEGLATARRCLGEAISEVDRQIAQLESMLDVSVDEDLIPLFANEGALVVQPGVPIPVVSLLLKVDDEGRALGTLDKLAAGAARYLEAPPATDTEIDGVAARELPLGMVSIFWAAFDGNLVVTSGRSGVEALRSDGDKLADDSVFKDAREAVDMPDETLGFVYVNFKEAVPLALDLAQLGGEPVPPDVRANVEPLQSLLVYVDGDQDEQRIAGLLRIE